MGKIYPKRSTDWSDLAFSFTWGNNAAICGASSHKFSFCDLNLSRGFGPERKGPMAQCLLMILRRGDIHKDRRDTDQQVGAWRHRQYKLCTVLATLLHLIWKLKNMSNISFMHNNKKKRNNWWDLPLLDFEKISQQSGPMKKIYQRTGIITSKVTHDRTHCIQLGGSEGLAPYYLHALSKHITDKFHKSYQSEVDKEVSCHCMFFLS